MGTITEFHQIDSWRVERLYGHARLIKYLLSCADNKGLTHGEKHHLITVALMETDWLLHEIHEHGISVLEQHVNVEPGDVPEIPF